LNYVRDLRLITHRYDLRRVAAADTALWVLHERSFGFPPKEAESIEMAFLKDSFMRRIRATNLFDRFLADSTYAELAHSLLPKNLQLAAQVGGIAFEQMVRRTDPGGTSWKDKDLGTLINQLYGDKRIDLVTRRAWQDARLVRNKAVHGDSLNRDEVGKLMRVLG
jgi:hypothetical protein